MTLNVYKYLCIIGYIDQRQTKHAKIDHEKIDISKNNLKRELLQDKKYIYQPQKES